MLGAMTGIVIHTLIVALGLSALLIASPAAFLVLKVCGAGYLVWLAYQAIRYGSTFNPERTQRKARSLVQNWATGLGINLMNPKIVLFFMTFLPQFVSANDPNAVGRLLFLGMFFIVLSLSITVALVLAADQFAGLLRENRLLARAFDYAFATVFGGFALKILATQRG